MSKPDFSEYDRKFDEWMADVQKELGTDMPFDTFYEEVSMFDPHGCFDGNMSAEEFADLVMEGELCGDSNMNFPNQNR
jgi:hypothetical protein